MMVLTVLLMPLAVWAVIHHRRWLGDRDLPAARTLGGFALWALAGAGAVFSGLSWVGPLVFLPVTALVVWAAAATSPATRAVVGSAAGAGAGLGCVAAFGNVTAQAAMVIGVVAALLALGALVSSVTLSARHRSRHRASAG